MKWRVIAQPNVKAEIRREAVNYEGKEKGLGKRFSAELRELRKGLSSMPERFQAWPDDPRFRRAMLPSFPFALFYLLDEPTRTVIVAAVVDLRREPGYWRRRR